MLAALLSLAAGEAPALIPTRDVDVTYDLPGHVAGAGDAVLSERLRWDTQAHLLRVDPPGPGIYMITDYAAHRVSVVRDADRLVVEAGAPAAALPGSTNTPYQRRGSDRVAGLACAEWATIDTEQHPVVVCVTDDGVLLRVRRDDRIVLAARRVTYGPQEAALFRVPPDYRRTGAGRAP